MGKGQVVGGQVKRLLHVCKAQSWAGVVGLWVKLESFSDNVVSDGGEEDAEFGRDVSNGANSCVSLTVGFMLLV